MSESLLGNAGTLFKGVPANPAALLDLCQLLEAAVTHERLMVVGFSAIDNPLAQRLRAEGVLRDLAHEFNAALKPGVTPSDLGPIDRTVVETWRMLNGGRAGDRGNALYNKLSFISLFDTKPDLNQRATTWFSLMVWLARVHEGAGDTADEPLPEEIRKDAFADLESYRTYAGTIASIAREHEISLLIGALEQPILDPIRLDTALPRDFLVEAYGAHFRRQIGATFRSIPAPPFAGEVLGEARSATEVIDALLRVRDRHAAYRQSLEKVRTQMLEARKASTTRQWMEYHRLETELEDVIAKSVARVEAFAPQRSLVFRVWDLVKAGNPLKIATNFLDLLVEKDEARSAVLRVEGVLDVVSRFPDIPFLDASSERLFGARMTRESMDRFAGSNDLLRKLYGVETAAS